jgi:hypothetical protein
MTGDLDRGVEDIAASSCALDVRNPNSDKNGFEKLIGIDLNMFILPTDSDTQTQMLYLFFGHVTIRMPIVDDRAYR